MDKIQMVDLNSQYMRIKTEVDKAVKTVIDSSAFINGKQVISFAENLARYNAVKHVQTCGNGTDALQIAFMALGLQAGDEVIVPVHTYVATAEVIALLGLKPVFVDCLPDLFTIDVSKIEAAITSKTRAVVPVHLYGQCADMQSILEITNKYSLFVVEDAAQAIGAEYSFSDGSVSKAGTMGDIGITSFFPSKNLGCFGDGGALFINDDKLAEKARMIANHGQSKKYHHDVIGCNSRLDTIQAAILDVKLKYLDEYSEARNSLADFYDIALNDIDAVEIPKRAEYSSHVFHQYTIKVLNGKRDVIKDALAKKGIPSMIYYPIPLHLQKAYVQEDSPEGIFPITESLAGEVLSLPMHTEMNDETRTFIVQTLIDILK
jgi:dTDP-4-amino-4,6-dideoxygalactose transaminase